MTDPFNRAALRFARAFVAGGIASLVTMLAAGIPANDFRDLRNLAFPLTIAFLSGALQGLDKLLRDAPSEPQS